MLHVLLIAFRCQDRPLDLWKSSESDSNIENRRSWYKFKNLCQCRSALERHEDELRPGIIGGDVRCAFLPWPGLISGACGAHIDQAEQKGWCVTELPTNEQAQKEERCSREREAEEGQSMTQENPCLYVGKNFVFDNRRYDPVIGVRASGDNQKHSIVGKCIICSCFHDDYDNGHAPSDHQEARCCRCRVLVLVCNNCRGKVRAWGEKMHLRGEDVAEMAVATTDIAVKPDLFCGDGGKECINEGNAVDHVEMMHY